VERRRISGGDALYCQVMIYVFDGFELDADKVELRCGHVTVPLEPQVFAVLLLLVENRERMVSKDEIIEKVWDGRIVSESAVTSRIKTARHALGDNGKSQKFIRTIHGSGFRFVAEVTTKKTETAGLAASAASQEPPEPSAAAAKPSIMVLPFQLVGIAGPYSTIADALPHELITELSRLRWLFVIASGTSFRFRDVDPDIRSIGALLNARYCLVGVVDIVGQSMTITVELADTRDAGIIWGERFAANVGRVFEIRSQIVASIVTALEIQIPLNEARLARLQQTEDLDAWQAYHIGLQHMFHFTCEGNAAAAVMFERALARDREFARAYAGLSFTCFQNAFMQYAPDPAVAADEAKRFAERAIELDPMDPFANFTMGRAFWLQGDLGGSLSWLDRATTLSPSYAQGVYARAWTDTVSGRGDEGLANADLAMSLSPLDPLHYAMLATRALAHVVRGEDAEAAGWAERAARDPGAHALIGMIAVIAHGLNGDDEKAAAWAANVRGRINNMNQDFFFRSFPFEHEQTRKRIIKVFEKYGF
jgi:DNA-binding winged helix-turn-helix (wHTH) protein/tetratricopeptide (TPR) repeat protein